MAKCRLLHQENEDLGRMTSSGRIAKLEGDLALQKSFSEEVKKSQSGVYDSKSLNVCRCTGVDKVNMLTVNSRIGRVPARAGRGCGGHAEHGTVPAAGAARDTRDCERQPAALAHREAHILGQ